jgi:hypothetical protein
MSNILCVSLCADTEALSLLARKSSSTLVSQILLTLFVQALDDAGSASPCGWGDRFENARHASGRCHRGPAAPALPTVVAKDRQCTRTASTRSCCN